MKDLSGEEGEAATGDSYEWHHGPDAEQRGVTAREAGFGTFEATQILPDIRVKRADPRILISDLLMDIIRAGHATGWEADGDLLRFRAINGTWVYRVGEYLEDRHAWVAEWPD